MNRQLRRSAIAFAICGASLALTGCGELKTTTTAGVGASTQTVTLALPQAPNANYVGIYEAQALGYFAQVGISVQIELPSKADVGSEARLGQLVAGHFDVTLASAPSVLTLQSQGAPIVAIGAVVQGALTTPEPQYAKQAKNTTTAAVTGTATQAKTTTEPNAKRKITGYKQVPDNSLLPSALRKRTDLPSYAGLVLVAGTDAATADRSLLRRFVQAIGRGYIAAREDPVAASRRLAKAIGGEENGAQLLAGVKHTLSAFFPGDASAPWGFQSGAQWQTLQSWLERHNLLANVVKVTAPFTNELLAGQGS